MSLYGKISDTQKLFNAWDKVRKNKPSAGVDGVTYEQYEDGKKGEIPQLNSELVDHAYHALPVKLVTIYREDNARTIALYAMRDKVVQQSLASELNKVFDGQFSDQTYAYRNNKSATVAIESISDCIRSGEYTTYIKVDISHYFDTILWSKLKAMLSENIAEEDVLELVRENSCSVSLDETSGELEDKRIGIYQGSGIAPILSNIYLMDFDKWLASLDNIYFVRYSDDMLILGNDRDIMTNLLQEIRLRLEELGLSLNDRKSSIGEISDGFDFLGYHFDINGKAVPAKAEASLNDRLELMWLTSGTLEVTEKLKKVLEIVGGWEQYFKDDRKIASIFEYAALIYAHGDDEAYRKELISCRRDFENYYHDMCRYLSSYWRRHDISELELLEYEQFFRVPSTKEIMLDDVVKPHVTELLSNYRQYIISEDIDILTEIIQCYTDLRAYPQAEYWHEQGELIGRKISNSEEALMRVSGVVNDISFSHGTPAKMIKLFVGREDIFAKEILDEHRGRKTESDPRPLTEQLIREHLTGKITAATYVQRPNATVRFIVFDIDVSKRVLLQRESESNEMAAYLDKALSQATSIKTLLAQMGIESYLEFSGYRGYHLWIFMTEWMPTRYANMLCDIVSAKTEISEDITVECFPNKTRLKGGKFGQVLKIPYGIHGKSGKRSFFIDASGNPITDVDQMTDTTAKVSLSQIKQVIGRHMDSESTGERREVDFDISAFGDISTQIKEVLMNCPLLRYLCQKSVKTGYLTHFERLTILYVFGHLGDDGKEFVHTVMKFTLNYKHNVTDHFIRKMPEKPISCVKLRDQYKQLTAEFGCSCVFKRNKNLYPSPVLHAISKGQDAEMEVTLPTSRTLSKEKTIKVKEELNIHSQAQELASQILECKKQKRTLNKKISKLEKELGKLFDAEGVDELELELGLLSRRRTENGVEWVIEI